MIVVFSFMIIFFGGWALFLNELFKSFSLGPIFSLALIAIYVIALIAFLALIKSKKYI